MAEGELHPSESRPSRDCGAGRGLFVQLGTKLCGRGGTAGRGSPAASKAVFFIGALQMLILHAAEL